MTRRMRLERAKDLANNILKTKIINTISLQQIINDITIVLNEMQPKR